MFRTIGLMFAFLAMFSIAGGHWAVLQTVAWAQMLRDYARGATIAEAVEKTFSGRAPCAMCKRIGELRQKEGKSSPAVKLDKKGELLLVSMREAIPRPEGRSISHGSMEVSEYPPRADAPPAPVPISRS